MNLQEIKKIMELFDNSDIAKFSIKQEGFELKLQKANASVSGAVTAIAPAPVAAISQTPVAESAPVATPSTPKDTSGHLLPLLWLGHFTALQARVLLLMLMLVIQLKKGRLLRLLKQ
ncbi:biotin carboxyl carrier protein [Helicobacter cinaedi]|uniref:Biotin carboxyl carrier protein n=1 Tax=Helicobacter cinaedi TaxID=213 RepID=A0A377JWT0_9HELI|nr:biotin carboxyl carrier protein [Helicobacter cinaedi]